MYSRSSEAVLGHSGVFGHGFLIQLADMLNHAKETWHAWLYMQLQQELLERLLPTRTFVCCSSYRARGQESWLPEAQVASASVCLCTYMSTHMHVQVYAYTHIAQCSSLLREAFYLLVKIAAAEYTEPELPLLLTSDSSTSSSCPGRLPGLNEGSTRVVTGMGAAVDSHAGSIALFTTQQHAFELSIISQRQQSKNCCRQHLSCSTN